MYLGNPVLPSLCSKRAWSHPIRLPDEFVEMLGVGDSDLGCNGFDGIAGGLEEGLGLGEAEGAEIGGWAGAEVLFEKTGEMDGAEVCGIGEVGNGDRLAGGRGSRKALSGKVVCLSGLQ